jgi:hypothetical protein
MNDIARYHLRYTPRYTIKRLRGGEALRTKWARKDEDEDEDEVWDDFVVNLSLGDDASAILSRYQK